MKIDRIEVFHLQTPQNAAKPGGETILVRMVSGDVSGWSEVSPGPLPKFGGEWTASAYLCVSSLLAPRIAGQTITDGISLHEKMRDIAGNRYAKAAIDMAWWDLKARLENKPLHQGLGGTKRLIEVGTMIDQLPTAGDFQQALTAAKEAGYARIELKFRPGWAIEMLNFARSELGAWPLHADVDGGLAMEHDEILYRFDDFMLEFVEQPLAPDDLVCHAMLQDAIQTPISLDESISTASQADMAIDLKSCRHINIRPDKLGGLTPAMQVHDLCGEHKINCHVGAGLQEEIGLRHAMALSSKNICVYPADFYRNESILYPVIGDPIEASLTPIEESDFANRRLGDRTDSLKVALWDAPGIGIEPDLSQIESLVVAKSVHGGE